MISDTAMMNLDQIKIFIAVDDQGIIYVNLHTGHSQFEMFSKNFVTALAFLGLTQIQLHLCGFAKKYKLSVTNIAACSDNEEMESPLRNLKYMKVNSTHGLLSYDVSFKRPLDENVWGHMKLEKWTEQGWTQLPLLPPQKDVCRSSLNSPLMRDMWISWAKLTNVAEPEKCPIPPGNYPMKEGLIDMSLLRKIPFWAGKFRVFITEFFQKSDNKLYCLEVNFEAQDVV
ncbi:uncharacterized protein LOC123321103 [Coccinella septempunctata]|uniref:uncharacterized protein LOC123321103 n=1 Tax=Coccinella septempunctata TaxID=41139 RepID=UPI001D094E47|nr:uncharacterized protein LOC123321103 [Coccinella septempunctata]